MVRKISVEQFKRNFKNEILELPFIVTKRDKAILRVEAVDNPDLDVQDEVDEDGPDPEYEPMDLSDKYDKKGNYITYLK